MATPTRSISSADLLKGDDSGDNEENDDDVDFYFGKVELNSLPDASRMAESNSDNNNRGRKGRFRRRSFSMDDKKSEKQDFVSVRLRTLAVL